MKCPLSLAHEGPAESECFCMVSLPSGCNYTEVCQHQGRNLFSLPARKHDPSANPGEEAQCQSFCCLEIEMISNMNRVSSLACVGKSMKQSEIRFLSLSGLTPYTAERSGIYGPVRYRTQGETEPFSPAQNVSTICCYNFLIVSISPSSLRGWVAGFIGWGKLCCPKQPGVAPSVLCPQAPLCNSPCVVAPAWARLHSLPSWHSRARAMQPALPVLRGWGALGWGRAGLAAVVRGGSAGGQNHSGERSRTQGLSRQGLLHLYSSQLRQRTGLGAGLGVVQLHQRSC